MKTTPENWIPPVRGASKERVRKEQGRMVGSAYVPNRIFRGKIVEVLRDAETGLTQEEIGRQICIDWNAELRPWLNELLKKLVREHMLSETGERYLLHR